MEKKIDHILQGREKNIGAETVIQPLPHKDFRFASPFIVLHHLLPHYYPPASTAERIAPHPHRGFAPVTFLFQGEGFHRDSRGNEGIIKAGEVQWMFAGKGLLHSEGPTKEFLNKGGFYEFVQIWINVPARYKWEEPWYQQVSKQNMPALFEEDGIDLRLASGSYGDHTGVLQSYTPVTSIFGTVPNGKTITLTAQERYWTLLYILEGAPSVNGKAITGQQLIVFSKDNTDISLSAHTDTKLLFLSAEPIDEPVAAKGNIVMNTQEEVQQAERDYANGKFGTLDF